MPKVAKETAYYLNGKVPAVALIAKGVRFPAGMWIRVTNAHALAWHVEDLVKDMFPALRDTVIMFATLISEFDVEEFERSLPEPS